MEKKVLILTVLTGMGHMRAAEAIQNGIERIGGDATSRVLDPLAITSPTISSLINEIYIWMAKFTPSLWGLIYNCEILSNSYSPLRWLCKRKYALSIREIINEFEPEVFVSTHPFTTLGVVTLKERGITKAPLVVVATDFDVHSFSINEWVDLFVVPCAEVSKYLQQKGIPSSKIEVFGIPVAPKFYLTKGKRELRVNLGLKRELPVILLISGAFGVTPIRELVTSFRNFNLPVQFLIVCGRNKKLKRVLEKEFGRLKLFGRVFGFVENMEELMEASDLIVTKPGGLICAEAAAKGLPMILLNPIKGQETKNAKTLLKARCALQPAGIKEAHEKILTLLTNTDLFEEMRANVRRITSPNSAIKIAYAVISLR